MCKKKFSGVLLLLLLLIPCFLSVSAGTAEATYEIIAAVRQGDYVYQRDVHDLSGYILNNVAREFCLAITGTRDEYFRETFSLSITIEPIGSSSSLSNVFINDYSSSATRSLYTCYPKRSFPTFYSAFSFPTFTIRILGNEGDQYRFTVTARDFDHGTTLSAKSFTLTVHRDNVSERPVITEPKAGDSFNLYFPGTSALSLKGERVTSWRIGETNISSDVQSFIRGFDITTPIFDHTTRLSAQTFYSSTLDSYDTKNVGYLTIYAANVYGYEVSRDIPIKVELAKKYKAPVIDNPTQDLSVLYASNAEAVFTGQYISAWTVDKSNLPGFIQDVTLDYKENSNKCKVNVFLSPDAAIGSTSALKLTAYNGKKTADATLNIKAIGKDEDYKTPEIDSDETISVIQGKSASAVFTGRYVKRWGYRSALPSDIADIKFNYDLNPNRCEVIVTAKSDAVVTSSPLSVDIYAYNTIGDETTTPKKLYINILQNDETAAPTIDDASTAKEISIVPDGTATVTFTGQHTRTWRWEKADSSSTTDIVKNIELNYLSNPARCEVKVTLNEELAAGLKDTINIYARNAVGTEVTTPAKLTITVASTGDNEDPVIDKSETVSVIKGGTAKATFTGQHIRSWAYGTLPEAIHAVELRPAANPNRCDVLVTASDNTDVTSAKVTIYAYNAIGEVTSADLNVTILSDGGSKTDPEIDGNKSVSVAKGGTARGVFTGKNIRAWAYGNLPEGVKSIQLNYAANPNRCDVLVTAASDTTATSGTVTIYAYNEIGEERSATLTVNFIDDAAKYAKPVIDTVKPDTVRVVQGGTVHVSLTGTNIVLWMHDDLPDGIKSLEFIYSNNPNKCTAAITAGSQAATGSKTITVYAFNEIGEYVSKTLTVNVIAADSGASGSGSGGTPTPTIDSDDLKDTIKVVPGGKISVSFDATGIYGLACSVLPNEIDYADWEVNDAGTKGVFFIAASSTATVGSKLVINVYGFNEIGAVSDSADIKLEVVEDKGNNNPVTKKSEETMVFEQGAIITDEFASENARNWYFDISELPAVVNAIDVSYDIDNPETCAVSIMLSNNDSLYSSDYATIAANNDYSFKVYAYDEIGSAASTDFTFTVSDSDDDDTDTDTDTDTDSGNTSSHGSSSGCNSGMSGLTLAVALTLIYYLTSRRKAL